MIRISFHGGVNNDRELPVPSGFEELVFLPEYKNKNFPS
jgi:hypothetical protein